MSDQIKVPSRSLSELMAAVGKVSKDNGRNGLVGEKELSQIGATKEERAILDGYARANGPMPYVPPST
jgi:hypothetical protein